MLLALNTYWLLIHQPGTVLSNPNHSPETSAGQGFHSFYSCGSWGLAIYISLVIQWLTLYVPSVGGLGSIPGQRTRPQVPQLRIGMPQPEIPHASAKTEEPARCNQDPPQPNKYFKKYIAQEFLNHITRSSNSLTCAVSTHPSNGEGELEAQELEAVRFRLRFPSWGSVFPTLQWVEGRRILALTSG